jgi:rhomboid family GlyGly-CTERM serine protease
MTRVRIDFPWTAAVCAAALVATAFASAGWGADALVSDRRLLGGELWRALTGPLVHATWAHLVRDVALTAIVGIAYEEPLARRWPVLILLGLAVPTLVSLTAGGVSIYYGLSGLSHALIAAAVGVELVARRGPARLLAAVVAAAMGAKVGYELVSGSPAFFMDLGEGVRQLPIAHAAGAAVGAGLAGWMARSVERAGVAAPRPSVADDAG